MHFRFLFEFQHSDDVSLSVPVDVEHGADLSLAITREWASLQRARNLSHIPFAHVNVYLQAVKGIYVLAKQGSLPQHVPQPAQDEHHRPRDQDVREPVHDAQHDLEDEGFCYE